MSDKKYPAGTHPNSLAALGRPWTSEQAKEAQLKGAKARSENAKKRNEMKESLKMWMQLKDEVLSDDLSAMDTLKLLLAKAIHENEFDTAADLATKLAEYEKPKLARQEVKMDDNKAEKMTDEELNERLKNLLKDAD